MDGPVSAGDGWQAVDQPAGAGEPQRRPQARLVVLLGSGWHGDTRPRDHRQVIEGVIYRLRTGVPWRDLPAEFGPWQTVWRSIARCFSSASGVTSHRCPVSSHI